MKFSVNRSDFVSAVANLDKLVTAVASVKDNLDKTLGITTKKGSSEVILEMYQGTNTYGTVSIPLLKPTKTSESLIVSSEKLKRPPAGTVLSFESNAESKTLEMTLDSKFAYKFEIDLEKEAHFVVLDQSESMVTLTPEDCVTFCTAIYTITGYTDNSDHWTTAQTARLIFTKKGISLEATQDKVAIFYDMPVSKILSTGNFNEFRLKSDYLINMATLFKGREVSFGLNETGTLLTIRCEGYVFVLTTLTSETASHTLKSRNVKESILARRDKGGVTVGMTANLVPFTDSITKIGHYADKSGLVTLTVAKKGVTLNVYDGAQSSATLTSGEDYTDIEKEGTIDLKKESWKLVLDSVKALVPLSEKEKDKDVHRQLTISNLGSMVLILANRIDTKKSKKTDKVIKSETAVGIVVAVV